MTVTTNHPASSYGLPVILADDGSVMDYADGVKALRASLQLTTAQLADACGVSRRTVEGWEQGRMPGAAALNVMGSLLSMVKTDGQRHGQAGKAPSQVTDA